MYGAGFFCLGISLLLVYTMIPHIGVWNLNYFLSSYRRMTDGPFCHEILLSSGVLFG